MVKIQKNCHVRVGTERHSSKAKYCGTFFVSLNFIALSSLNRPRHSRYIRTVDRGMEGGLSSKILAEIRYFFGHHKF